MNLLNPSESVRVSTLGAHLLEMGDDGSLLLVDQAQSNQTTQLDAAETYRLYLELHAWFQEQTEHLLREAGEDMSGGDES